VHIPPDRANSAIEWMEGAPLYRLRGQLLPLIFLDRMLSGAKPASARQQLPGATDTMPEGATAKRNLFICVLDADGRRFGLVVDGLANPEEIVVKPLSPVLKSIGLYSGATVLGSGDLALILDPGSLANRAGVTMRSSEEQQREGITGTAVDDLTDSMASRFLLVEAAGRRAAVPLGDVLRIELIPLSRIEYIGYRPVLNFEGNLLPVEDSGGVLAAANGDPNAPLTIVVCREGNRQVGIAVNHVLDVAAGSDLVEAGTRQHAAGVTLLKDQVTGVVNLSAVPPLPAAQSQPNEWNAEEAMA
jgi:two-component system chemotaxis sensor kinase CheA